MSRQVRAEATAAARREVDAQTKSVEKGREDIRALQDRLAQAQQDNTRQTHLLAAQAAENEQRAAKLAKQEVVLPSQLTHGFLLGNIGCNLVDCFLNSKACSLCTCLSRIWQALVRKIAYDCNGWMLLIMRNMRALFSVATYVRSAAYSSIQRSQLAELKAPSVTCTTTH